MASLRLLTAAQEVHVVCRERKSGTINAGFVLLSSCLSSPPFQIAVALSSEGHLGWSRCKEKPPPHPLALPWLKHYNSLISLNWVSSLKAACSLWYTKAVLVTLPKEAGCSVTWLKLLQAEWAGRQARHTDKHGKNAQESEIFPLIFILGIFCRAEMILFGFCETQSSV